MKKSTDEKIAEKKKKRELLIGKRDQINKSIDKLNAEINELSRIQFKSAIELMQSSGIDPEEVVSFIKSKKDSQNQ